MIENTINCIYGYSIIISARVITYSRRTIREPIELQILLNLILFICWRAATLLNIK